MNNKLNNFFIILMMIILVFGIIVLLIQNSNIKKNNEEDVAKRYVEVDIRETFNDDVSTEIESYHESQATLIESRIAAAKFQISSMTKTLLVSKEMKIEKIINFFVEKGLSETQAAGIVGNLQTESKLNARVIQGGGVASINYLPEPSVGFGLAQWTTPDRQQRLIDFSEASNVPITDFDMQLEFIWEELNNDYSKVLVELKTADNPVDAASIFHDGYERSADSEHTVISVRGGRADEAYRNFRTSQN